MQFKNTNKHKTIIKHTWEIFLIPPKHCTAFSGFFTIPGNNIQVKLRSGLFSNSMSGYFSILPNKLGTYSTTINITYTQIFPAST